MKGWGLRFCWRIAGDDINSGVLALLFSEIFTQVYVFAEIYVLRALRHPLTAARYFSTHWVNSSDTLQNGQHFAVSSDDLSNPATFILCELPFLAQGCLSCTLHYRRCINPSPCVLHKEKTDPHCAKSDQSSDRDAGRDQPGQHIKGYKPGESGGSLLRALPYRSLAVPASTLSFSRGARICRLDNRHHLVLPLL